MTIDMQTILPKEKKEKKSKKNKEEKRDGEDVGGVYVRTSNPHATALRAEGDR